MEKKALEGVNILLVEDNLLNQEIAYELLVAEGAKVTVASDGLEAVEAVIEAQKEDIDIIIMDIMMPIMDGYEATKAIRSLESELANITIIAMTANVSEDNKIHARNVGMNGYIEKPFDINKLISVIKK